jgi:hypothetical protein
MIIAVGIMLGILCIASVSIVIGSILGTAVGYVVEAISVPGKIREGIKGIIWINDSWEHMSVPAKIKEGIKEAARALFLPH